MKSIKLADIYNYHDSIIADSGGDDGIREGRDRPKMVYVGPNNSSFLSED